MTASVAFVRARILCRSPSWPEVVGHVVSLRAGDGWLIATDGVCALMVKDTRAYEHRHAPANMVEILFREPDTMRATSVAALKAWAGAPPVPVVVPCPAWARHEREAAGILEPQFCYDECQWVEGLGFACEAESRGTEWGIIASIVVNRTRLAELVSCCEDGEARYGEAGGALYVWAGRVRLALREGNEVARSKATGPAFKETRQ